MSEQGDIQQKITEAEYAATSATGDANITIIKNYYYREEARITPDVSESGDIALPCPYRGLFHFGPNDAELFFGRDIFIEELYKATQNRNFIPVLGASGSGKSSVILAGLVPKLQKEGHWQFTHFRPGSDPFYALAEALVPLYRSDADSTDRITQAAKLAESLKEGIPLSRVFSAIQRNYPQYRVLLIGDQFEEIYTLCRDDGVRRQFLDCLLSSLETGNSLSAVAVVWAIAMRADFLGNALTYPPFADVLQDWDLKLRSMKREELAEVVEKPAASLGVGFEGGLVERILDDVEDQPGNLPLLEFALTELWEKRTGEVLTHEIYEAIGGVEGALARHADEKYSNLREGDRDRVRRIFIQLVRPGEGTEDTRRIATKEELGAQNWALVKQLADVRLVVTSRNAAGRETVEVVHEALIRNWGELRGWMERDRAFRSWQDRLRVFKRQWEENGRDASSLLRGAALVEAEEWLEKRSDELISEAEFIRLSIGDRDKLEKEKEARRRYNIGMAWSITGSSLLALFISIKLWSMARYEEKRAELNQADSLARYSLSLLNEDKDLDALLEAIRAGKILRKYKAIDPEVMSALIANIYEGRETKRLEGHNKLVSSVSFSGDGKFIASGNWDRTIKLWNVETGEVIRTLQGHDREVVSVSLGKEGNILASGDWDGIIKLWNVKTKEEIHTFRQGSSVQSVSLSRDGDILASGGDNGIIKLWNVNKKEVINTLQHDREPIVWSVSLSSDGSILASGDANGVIKLWNVKKGEAIRTLQHNDFIFSVDFSPDGKFVASGSRDTTIKLWDVKTGKTIHTLQNKNEVSSVSFSPDGKVLASGSGNGIIKLWNVETGEEIYTFQGHDNQVNSVSFNPDGKILISGSQDRTIKLWNVETGEQDRFQGYNYWIDDINLSSDGKVLASHGLDKTIKLWNVQTGEVIQPLQWPHGEADVISMSLSGNGRVLAYISDNNNITLWDVEKEEIRTLQGHDGWANNVSLSSDGKVLASGDRSGIIKVWNVKTGREIRTLQGTHGEAEVTSMSLSSNGKVLAYSSGDYNITLWDVEKEKEIDTLQGHDVVINSLHFSEDGKILASGSDDNTIKLWNVQTGEEIHTLQGHKDWVIRLSFSEDGKILASGSNDNTIKLWNVETGEELHTLQISNRGVWNITLSNEGKILAYDYDRADNTIKLWNLGNLEFNTTFIRIGCDRIRNYLKHNPNVKPEDRTLCNGIGSE